MQVDPIKPTLKAPGSNRLKLKIDILLSTAARKFNLSRHSKAKLLELFEKEEEYKRLKKEAEDRKLITLLKVGRCRLTPG